MTPQELKDSIIRLAMQGKLVEQRTNEGTARILRLAIDEDRKQKVQNKIVKVNKKVEPITEDEIPFDIPDSWEWIRFGDMVSYNMGKTPPRAESEWWSNDFPWVSIADMPESGHITETKECVSLAAITENFSGKIAKAGTLLMSFKLTVGRVSILDIDAVHNEAIISIYPYADSEGTIQDYLFQLLPYISQFGDSKNAIKGKTLNDTSISNLLIPLPPLAEQKRIVAKIEELLPYIERYEQAWSKLEDFNKRFPVDMQKSILQMAIQGKLVPQLTEEGTGEELFQQIQREKQALIKAGKIKKEKPLPKITEDEISFDIPESWKWARLSEIISVLGDGIHGTPVFDEMGDYYFVNGNNLVKGNIIFKADTKKVSYSEYEKHKKPLDENTILISINGTIGNYAFYAGEPIILGKSACYFSVLTGIDKEYIRHLINTKFFMDYAVKEATQTTIKNVSLKAMRMFPVPLPPLTEQKRIVAKLEEILPLCERLK